jgi:hypothetical protein
MTQIHETREAWLVAAIEKLRPIIDSAIELSHQHEDAHLGSVRVSVGFATKSARVALGCCFGSDVSEDGDRQIYISPVIGPGDVATRCGVLPTLLHELCHAALPEKCKHGPWFKRLMVAVGLAGKATTTHASDEIMPKLTEIAEALGDFPHAKLTPFKDKQPQKTRMIKCECASCGYVARTTQKWIDKPGAPFCPCTGEQMFVYEAENEA